MSKKNYDNHLFRFEKHINDYLMESLTELHYTAPDIYDRKIKAVSTTFPRNRLCRNKQRMIGDSGYKI